MTRAAMAPALLLALGLGCPPKDPEPLPDAGEAQRRWLKPPPGEVRAYPPHAIRSDGVGPYLLGAPMSEVLHLMTEGPRVELLQVGRLVNWRVARAEGGSLLIGAGKDNRVAYIAVLSPEVAKLEGGAGVGATGSDLVKALGAPLERSDRGYSRSVLEFARLPNVRFLMDAAEGAPLSEATVMAVVVGGEQVPSVSGARFGVETGGGPDAGPPAAESCRRGDALAAHAAELGGFVGAEAGDGGGAGGVLVRHGCFTQSSAEALVLGDGRMALVAGEAGKLRLRWRTALPQHDFVTVIDVDADGHDEIIVGRDVVEPGRRAVEIRVLRWEGGRLAQVLEDVPLDVSAAEAQSAGVKPAAIDLVVELRAEDGVLAVGGFYLTRKEGSLAEVAPVWASPLRVPSRRPAPPPAALRPDGGVDAGPRRILRPDARRPNEVPVP